MARRARERFKRNVITLQSLFPEERHTKTSFIPTQGQACAGGKGGFSMFLFLQWEKHSRRLWKRCAQLIQPAGGSCPSTLAGRCAQRLRLPEVIVPASFRQPTRLRPSACRQLILLSPSMVDVPSPFSLQEVIVPASFHQPTRLRPSACRRFLPVRPRW